METRLWMKINLIDNATNPSHIWKTGAILKNRLLISKNILLKNATEFARYAFRLFVL
jgi:hypothetical protein